MDERIWGNKGNPKKKAGNKKIRKDNKDSFHKITLSKERYFKFFKRLYPSI